MKKLLLSAVLLVSALLLMSCTEPKAATFGEAYGPGHHAVAYASIKTDGTGNISEAIFEEYRLPEAWAVITGVDAEVEGLVTLVGSVYFAQYVSIDGEIFTLNIVEEAAVYLNSADQDVLTWVENPVNAKRYIDACLEGDAFVSNSEGVKSETYDQEHKWTKIEAGYWPANATTLGYATNINHLIASVEGRTLSEDDAVVRGDNKIWSVNDAVTGATNNDFKLYYDYLVEAYLNREVIA